MHPVTPIPDTSGFWSATFAMAAIVVVGLLAGWVIQSTMEARMFNQVTGKHVTTWQAMWIDLRVQEQAR